ncbi:MAG: diacylglycerol kinase family lipid kinase [Clostridiales bacterium]|nr:diacylglycerol kinase family lipid kinase [Clostridiales bacterium]
MKKLKIIQNPSSGRVGFEDEFNELCRILLNKSYLMHLFKTQKKDDAYYEAKLAVNEGYDMIIVSGGDGTVNEVAKALYETRTDIPMAIFRTGTVNDFATHLKLPNTAEAFVRLVEAHHKIPVDIGVINGDVFINIAAAGIFTSIAHETKKEVKKYLGRSAYYLEAMMNLPKSLTQSYRLKVTSEEFNHEDDYHLFLITNSSSVGGFDKMSPIAEIQDGYFDCIFLKKAPIMMQADLFMKILMGKHLESKYVDFFRSKHLKIELMDNQKLDLDIDGEIGGDFPIDIEVVPAAIYVIAEE